SGTFLSAFIRHQEVDVESAAPAERLTRQLRLSTKCLFIFQPGLARDCRGHTTVRASPGRKAAVGKFVAKWLHYGGAFISRRESEPV
ncbi:MAG: hypothetical protein NZ914_14480, partial [Gemmatales bacterium]|nr:hypothetical protein [Gemmatales bacterium]